MNKWLRRGLVAAGVLVALMGGAVVTGDELAEGKMNRRIDLPPYPVALKDDAASIERGRYLYQSRGCVHCHGAAGTGQVFVDDGKGLKLGGPAIGTGAGSVTAKYQPADWERAIRHGVKPDGRPTLIMPSEDYNRLTDDDLAALVAYVRRLPPGPGRAAVLDLPLVVRVMYGFGAIPDAASRIDHSLAPGLPVAEGVTVEHGKYVAQMCIGCHGEKFAGGRIPGSPPDWPAAADLRAGAPGMKPYADDKAFLAMFRTGQRPDGSKPKVMPFDSLKLMSDVDVLALHLYLKTLPASAEH
jgi:cytochrome c553